MKHTLAKSFVLYGGMVLLVLALLLAWGRPAYSQVQGGTGRQPPPARQADQPSTPHPMPLHLRVGIYENMPLSGLDEHGAAQGIFVEVLLSIAKEENWVVEWRPCDFPECLSLLESGEIDLLGVIAYGIERAQRFDFSHEAVITNWGRVYTAPDSRIQSLLDLDNVPLALLKGDIHAQVFETLAQRFDIHPQYQWYDTYADVFQAVHAGRAEAGIVNRMFGEAQAQQFNLRPSPIIFNPLSIQFAATQGAHPEVLAAVDRHVRAMKADSDSVYYHALEQWMGGPAPRLVIPPWLVWGLVLAAFGILVFLGTSVVLQHRLRSQMAELDLQNKRLMVEIQQHQATQEMLHLHTAALEAAANAVIITDRQGNILWVNPAYTRLTGFSRQESVGKTPRLLRSELTPSSVHADLWEHITNGKVWHGELINRHKDGHTYVEEITITPILDSTGQITHFIAIQQDITARKEQEIAQKARLQIIQTLEDANTEAEIIDRMLAQVQEIFSVRACAFSRGQRGNGEYIVAARGQWEPARGSPLPRGWPLPAPEDDILLAQRTNEEGTGLPFLGVLRLTVGSDTLGHLWIGSLSPLQPTTRHVLLAIHPAISHALQRARLLANTRKQLQRINALHAIDMAIASSVDVNITLNILLEQLVHFVPAETVIISTYSPEDNTLQVVQHRNLPETIRSLRTHRLTAHYVATVMRTRKPLIIPDIREATQPLDEVGQYLSQYCRGYVCLPLLAKGKINGVLEIYSQQTFQQDEEWLNFLHILSGQAAIAIENAMLFTDLQRSKDELSVAYESALLGWSRSLAVRHREPPEHAERVAQLALALARTMGIRDENVLRSLRYGAWIHDIGKLGIPEAILHKSEPLTPQECAIFQRSAEFARQFLQDIPYLDEAAIIPVYRYERWDGSGHPLGISGNLIPLPARIFSVVHAWDARSEARHYQPAMSRAERIAYLQAQAGKQFDPRVVKAFLESGLV